ncbi:hypothetical protein [Deinococcus indicus]|nr:hypothetical protein [Deinococcus indicus]
MPRSRIHRTRLAHPTPLCPARPRPPIRTRVTPASDARPITTLTTHPEIT